MHTTKRTFVMGRAAWRAAAGIGCLALGPGNVALGSEGGSSIYLQGTYGDFGAGVQPAGFQIRNDIVYWDAGIDSRPLGGGVSAGIDQELWLNYLKLGWFGGEDTKFGFTLSLPVLATGEVEKRPGIESIFFDSTPRAGIGDPVLTPQVNWSSDAHHFSLGVGISFPVGEYEMDREVTAGRNYWGFDPQVTYTYLNDSGFEISGTTGVMFNLENADTNYETGEEFHLDLLLGKRWGGFGIGALGYWYEQFGDDTGNIAPNLENGYPGRTVGAGVALSALFSAGNFDGMIVGKWLHDVDTSNHFEGDLYMLSFEFKPADRPAPAPVVAAPPPPPPAPPPPPPPPPPPDSDADGVVDANDLCADTPRGDRIDAQGCSCDVSVRLHFGFDSAELTPEDKQELDAVLVNLRRLPQVRGEVAGYSDSRGKEEYNLNLSRRRAQAVVDYLESRGIPASRLVARGYGEADPVADNTTEDGRAQNRRVVLRRSDCGM